MHKAPPRTKRDNTWYKGHVMYLWANTESREINYPLEKK